MTQIHQLLQLQKLDSEIDEKKKILSGVLKAQKEPPALLKMRERTTKAAETLKTWQNRHAELMLEVKSVTLKAAESDEQLYQGKVTNPKILADLQQEVESLGRRKMALEGEIAEADIKLEAAQKEDSIATDEQETAVEQWDEQSAHLKVEQNKLALNLHKLMQERKAKVEKLEEASLDRI